MTSNIQRWHQIYKEKIKAVNYQEDSSQLKIIDHFARIENEFFRQKNTQIPTSFMRQLSNKWFNLSSPIDIDTIKGFYLYGIVGRGKTFLLDLFSEHSNLDIQRIHFHHFMKSIHDELKQIKNQTNPLDIITKQFSEKYQVLCLDEFMVTDITDAMLLYGILKGLIENHVVILITTNISPDDLYKNGLQRERFIPAIDLIKSQLFIHDIGEGQDYRKCSIKNEKRFFTPNNAESEQSLQSIFDRLSNRLAVKIKTHIFVNNRNIAVVAFSDEVIWFDFNTLCGDFRSQLDYLYLAKKFPIFIVSNIPVLDEFKEEEARRFLLLIDELYDKRITLFISSEKVVTEIYQGKRILFEFDRLQSRLYEMQSKNYG